MMQCSGLAPYFVCRDWTWWYSWNGLRS